MMTASTPRPATPRVRTGMKGMTFRIALLVLAAGCDDGLTPSRQRACARACLPQADTKVVRPDRMVGRECFCATPKGWLLLGDLR